MAVKRQRERDNASGSCDRDNTTGQGNHGGGSHNDGGKHGSGCGHTGAAATAHKCRRTTKPYVMFDCVDTPEFARFTAQVHQYIIDKVEAEAHASVSLEDPPVECVVKLVGAKHHFNNNLDVPYAPRDVARAFAKLVRDGVLEQVHERLFKILV